MHAVNHVVTIPAQQQQPNFIFRSQNEVYMPLYSRESLGIVELEPMNLNQPPKWNSVNFSLTNWLHGSN